MNTKLQKRLQDLSLSMFRKDFFGIFHGSISAKTEKNRFLINTQDAIFDNLTEKSLIELYYKRDNRWKDASIDSHIHHAIYSLLTDAKFITFTMPQFTTAYSINHSIIIPCDYFGMKELGSITVYHPKAFEDWYDRAASEISQYFLQNDTDIMIIRGYGVYCYHRDLNQMARKLAILEKSCRLLMLNANISSSYED